MFSNTRKLLTGAATLAVAVLLAQAPAHSAVFYDNLGAASDGSDPVDGLGPIYQSFSGAATPMDLYDVSLLLQSSDPSSTGGIQISLVGSSGGLPDLADPVLETIGTLADSDVTTAATGAVYTFSLSTPFLLDANATYWIEVAAQTGSFGPLSSTEWLWSLDTGSDTTGVAGQSVDNAFGPSPVESYGAYQMQAAVPEPATWAMFLIGFGGIGLTLRNARRKGAAATG